MILFYNKKTGKVFGTIDGRVHDQRQMKCEISDSTINKKDVGKMVIGWEEDGKKRKEHNMDKFDILKKFESKDKDENPMNYQVKGNKLIKFNNK